MACSLPGGTQPLSRTVYFLGLYLKDKATLAR
jgi:hypothetical protein